VVTSPHPSRASARPRLGELLHEGSLSRHLGETFRAAGHELYLVGGRVRDALLGRDPDHLDFDFATDAPPERTRALVEPLASAVWLQGIEFGTVGARIDGLTAEITTYRTERYMPSSRHPDVTFAADITTDLSRRDFTVNAMAVGLPDGALVDPFGGQGDLDAGRLRTPIDPRDSFADDPLRMLRAFRFASELGFGVDTGVLAAVSELRDALRGVSAERIRDELSRLLEGADPGRALELADATGLSDLFLPELSQLKLEQDPVHRHKDVFRHTLAVVERAPADLEVRLAALLHDVGKPRTRRITPEGVTFHLHEVVGAKIAGRRLRELRYPSKVVDDVTELIRLHHRFHTYGLGWSDSAVRRYVRDAGALLGELNDLVRADCTTRNPAKARRLAARMDELERRIAELAEQEELRRIRPELDGRQVMAFLGAAPGPIVGDALDFLLELRLEEGLVGPDAAYGRLDAWARTRGLTPAGERVPPKQKERGDG
jgi:poly(A) polymerase